MVSGLWDPGSRVSQGHQIHHITRVTGSPGLPRVVYFTHLSHSWSQGSPDHHHQPPATSHQPTNHPGHRVTKPPRSQITRPPRHPGHQGHQTPGSPSPGSPGSLGSPGSQGHQTHHHPNTRVTIHPDHPSPSPSSGSRVKPRVKPMDRVKPLDHDLQTQHQLPGAHIWVFGSGAHHNTTLKVIKLQAPVLTHNGDCGFI